MLVTTRLGASNITPEGGKSWNEHSPHGTAGELLRLDYDVNSSLTGFHVIVLLHLNVIGLPEKKKRSI